MQPWKETRLAGLQQEKNALLAIQRLQLEREVAQAARAGAGATMRKQQVYECPRCSPRPLSFSGEEVAITVKRKYGKLSEGIVWRLSSQKDLDFLIGNGLLSEVTYDSNNREKEVKAVRFVSCVAKAITLHRRLLPFAARLGVRHHSCVSQPPQ